MGFTVGNNLSDKIGKNLYERLYVHTSIEMKMKWA